MEGAKTTGALAYEAGNLNPKIGVTPLRCGVCLWPSVDVFGGPGVRAAMFYA